MRFRFILLSVVFLLGLVAARAQDPHGARKQAMAVSASSNSTVGTPRQSVTLFDNLKNGEDVIYLVSNSSFVWGPDPSGLSEEITFTGLVTVPKWPMKGYERRVLADGREQIDIELSESQLKGESYLLGSTVKLGEHPDLRSLGTITAPAPAAPRLVAAAAKGAAGDGTAREASAANSTPPPATSDSKPASFRVSRDVAQAIQNAPQVLWGQMASDEIGKLLAMPPNRVRRMVAKKGPAETQEVQLALAPDVLDRLKRADLDANLLMNRVLSGLVVDLRKNGGLDGNPPSQLVIPHDFVVARKVLLTTAKGVLYNETAVPVRGKLDSIPPIHSTSSPAGVDIFHGMELPIPLLDKDKNVDGWFYSKAHVAMPVHPTKIEKETMKADLTLRAGDREEIVHVEGQAEIHHGPTRTHAGRTQTDIEVMVMALRGKSDLLGGNVMIIEAFSEKDKFSRGHMVWEHNKAVESPLDLYFQVYTPSGMLHNEKPVSVMASVDRLREDGVIEKGNLRIPTVKAVGAKPFVSSPSAEPQDLFNDADRATVQVKNMRIELVAAPAGN